MKGLNGKQTLFAAINNALVNGFPRISKMILDEKLLSDLSMNGNALLYNAVHFGYPDIAAILVKDIYVRKFAKIEMKPEMIDIITETANIKNDQLRWKKLAAILKKPSSK